MIVALPAVLASQKVRSVEAEFVMVALPAVLLS